MSIIPVMLSQNCGLTFWPMARKKLPSQFCEINGYSIHGEILKALSDLGSPWTFAVKELMDLNYLFRKKHKQTTNQIVLLEPNLPKEDLLFTIGDFFKNKGIDDATLIIISDDLVIKDQQRFMEFFNIAITNASSNKFLNGTEFYLANLNLLTKTNLKSDAWLVYKELDFGKYQERCRLFFS